MKINSISRQTAETNSNPNYFSSTFQSQQPGSTFQNQSNTRSNRPIQIFGNQSETPLPLTRQLQDPSNQIPRNPSPNKNRRFDIDGNTSVTSFDPSKGIRRPLSHVPGNTRSGLLVENSIQSNLIGRSPLINQPQTNTYQNTPSQNNFQTSTIHTSSIPKEQLRDNIGKKNQLVNDLTANRNFFKEKLETKYNEFKEFIRLELKKNVYDKVMKTSLHYIYKHHENLKTTVNRDETLRILNTNLSKQKNEINETKKQISHLETSNKQLEDRLLSIVNQPKLIKTQPTIVENISKAEIERKVQELNRENIELEKALLELKKRKETHLYDLRMKHENKGRVLMEQRAIKLALQYVDVHDSEQVGMKMKIENLIRQIESNNNVRKTNPNYELLERKLKLEKELEILRFSS